MKRIVKLMVLTMGVLILAASCGPLRDHSKGQENKSAKENHANKHHR